MGLSSFSNLMNSKEVDFNAFDYEAGGTPPTW